MGNNKGLVIIYRIILIITGILAGLYLYLRIRLFWTGYNSKELKDAVTTTFKIYKWFGYTSFFLTFLTLKSTSLIVSVWRVMVMSIMAICILGYSVSSSDPNLRGWMTVLLDFMCIYNVLYIFTSIYAIVKTLRNKK